MTQNKYVIIGIVVCLAVLSILSTDFYVPAMPHMVADLLTSSRIIKLTVTVFVLGMAFSPLIFGPISDRFGRRPVLLIAAGLGFVGSLLCWLAPMANVLIMGRLLQGIGLGSALSLARTIGSDLFEKQEFAQVAGIMSLCTAIGPVIAPVIGGYLHVHFGWRSIFLLVTVLVALSGLAILQKVPETIAKCDPHALRLRDIINNYRELLVNRIFMCNTIIAGLSVSCIILFGMLSTFILQHEYALSPIQYAWVMMLVTGSSIMSRTANIILLRTKTPEYCINVGLFFMTLGACLALVTSLLELHFAFCIIIPAMMVIFGAGIVPSNTVALALAPFRHKGGSAGAIYGSITMLGVFLVSLFASILPANSVALAMIYLTLSLLSILMVMLQIPFRLSRSPDQELINS